MFIGDQYEHSESDELSPKVVGVEAAKVKKVEQILVVHDVWTSHAKFELPRSIRST